MRGERTHAALVGERERGPIARFGFRDGWLVTGGDPAQQMEDPCLQPPLASGARDLQGLPGLRERRLGVTRHEMGVREGPQP
jgi:hypothetical protein